MKFERLLLVAVVLVLSGVSGCQSTGKPKGGDDRDLAGEVRQAASDQNGVINVHPLTDPAAEELIGQARWLEQQQRLDESRERVIKALEISPQDPGYWQYLAELELQRENYREAVRNAGRSFELGPQMGDLCYRNWLTLNRAYQALGQESLAQTAGTRADQCTVRERKTY